MLALIRIPTLFVAFIVINLLLLVVCTIRPFHRNNVYIAGQMYSQMAKIIGLKLILRVDPALDKTKQHVFIANHQNSYDIFTICKAALPGVVTIGKKSLKWIPVFGQLYWLSGNIMIDRGHSGRARNTLTYTANKMRDKNISVWFFPEGTRSYGRGLLPFKAGAFKLAKETHTPLSVVTASNTHNKVKLNRWDNGSVIIDVSPAESLDGDKTVKEWMEYFHTKMNKKFQEINAEVAELEK